MAGLPEIPVLDVSSVAGDDQAGLDRLAREIGAACRDIGFFYVTHHGIPPALVDRTFAMARAFFALQLKAKLAVAMANSPHNRGYMPFEGETLDPDRPARHPPTTGATYLKERLDATQAVRREP